MRRLAYSLVPALALAALAVPFAGTSYASTCAAVAQPPHLMVNESEIHASGTFACGDAATGMTVTVCIEEEYTVTGEWFSLGCDTTTATTKTHAVYGVAGVPQMVYSTYLRTTVLGTNDAGDTAGAKSAPMFWFNCACYVG